jgi:glycosyltransferase involved in cell wall biosynthesis
MRIAILHYTKPPVVGGVERVVGEQARALEALGHQVDVFDANEALEFRGRFDSGGFDGVVVHNVFTMPFDLSWTRELTDLTKQDQGACWVNWVHDVAALNPAYAGMGWSETVPRATHVAVSGVRAREWAKVSGIPISEVPVIPNGVDPAAVLGLTSRVAGLAAARDLWGSDLNLLQPVRLVRRKNVELGIELMRELKDRGVKARLVVTGAPDPHQGDGTRYFETLRGLVVSRDVEQEVVFAGCEGSVSDDDVRGLYALCDGLFFPSRSEGFGLPLLEAGLHRLPIWCSELPVHREVIGEDARWFDPDGDAGVLACRMVEWCRSDRWLLARRRIWREHEWQWLCKERLVPLLQAGIKRE